MVNAYLLVEITYKEDPELEYFLPIKLANSFLREQAWSGTKKNELKLVWNNIYAYMLASVNNDFEPFVIEDVDTLKIILQWLRDCAVDFPFDNANVLRLLDNIKSLHGFLNANQFPVSNLEKIKKYINDIYSSPNELDLSKIITKGKVMKLDFKKIKPQKTVIYIREHIAELVPKVLNILKTNAYKDHADKTFMYYQYFWERYLQQETGPTVSALGKDVYDIPSKEVDPYCMLSFVEYLLFAADFPKVKLQLLEKLLILSSKQPGFQAFLNFYKQSQLILFKICTADLLVGTTVRNIFNDETIYLANVDLNYGVNRDRLFFAYFNQEDKILPSTILSVSSSKKQEQFLVKIVETIFNFENTTKNTSKETFFKENSQFIRYLLVLTNLDKTLAIKVVSWLKRQKNLNHPQLLVLELRKIEREILNLAKKLKFSQGDLTKLTQLWRSFCNLKSLDLSELEYYKFAILLCYCEFIYPVRIVQKIREIFAIKEQVLQKYILVIKTTMELDTNNFQYLTEYGKIQLLIRLRNEE